MGLDLKRIPTGVSDFDAIINGGLPSGSVVLLLGETGAGQQEFVYTSAAKVGMVMERPQACRHYLGDHCDYHALPDRICYLTFSRSVEDILMEVKASFNPNYFKAMKERVFFKDLSGSYFKRTRVPSSWTHPGDDGSSLFSPQQEEDVLEALVDFVDANGKNALVIIDSLTDLVISKAVDIRDLVGVLRGMQRAAKRWDGIIYLLLTNGIMDAREQQMVIDSVDGVFVFEWSKYHRSSKRQRYMYVEKFMSVLPHLDMKRIARFPTMVNAHSGLVVISLEMIE
ncbi:MAG: ATPase domain-containing protein [Candidatus Thermoplasmatota archaeon]